MNREKNIGPAATISYDKVELLRVGGMYMPAEGMRISDERAVHAPSIRYLGNKRHLIQEICDAVLSEVPEGCRVLDLFAGTNIVGHALRSKLRVVTNDNQEFSYVISRALVAGLAHSCSLEAAISQLTEPFRENLRSLSSRVGDLPYREALSVSEITLDQYLDLETLVPCVPRDRRPIGEIAVGDIDQRRGDPWLSPSMLMTAYFSFAYFGLWQSMELDSLRSAIEQVPSPQERDSYLAALIYAASDAVASPGHFAQCLRPCERNFHKIRQARLVSIPDRFLLRLHQLIDASEPTKHEAEAWHKDFEDFTESDLAGFDLVYADPPYTCDQYSRYYHVIETLVKYDYPSCDYFGRYRGDRRSSGFSRKRQAARSFERLASLVSAAGCKLIISYNNDGVISLEEIIGIMEDRFSEVQSVVLHASYNHSNQGRATDDCQSRQSVRTENVIICRRPRP